MFIFIRNAVVQMHFIPMSSRNDNGLYLNLRYTPE